MENQDLHHGPRFDVTARSRLQQMEDTGTNAPTCRGWVLCVLSCAALGIVVPVVDNLLQSTRLSLNLLPASSILLMMFFIIGFNMLLGRHAQWLALTRQDLALIFCATMLVNPLPSLGFIGYLTAAQHGPIYFARPENNWDKLLHPYLSPTLFPRDPIDPHSLDPRPIEWFYAGMPPGQSIPWDHLIGPYALWCLSLTMILGIFFALGALLHRQWSQQERLPFPLVQVPEIMMQGLFSRAEKPFFLSKLAWWGIAITFLLHSYNALQDYFPNVPPIPLKIVHLDWTYLTEPPFRYMTPFRFNIFPSIVGIMYLVSLEASFSLWFFYGVISKIVALIAIGYFALGWSAWDLNRTDGAYSVCTAQGTGACFALVLAAFYMARRTLWESLRQALGLAPRENTDDLSPRVIWGLLIVCLFGVIAWLIWMGVSWYWAVVAVAILLASATGITRLVSESGVFFLQMQASPAELMTAAFTPVALGPKNFVLLSTWSRAFVFDWYRSCPFINILGALHLGSRTGLKQKPLLLGLALGLLVIFSVGFVTFYYTAYMGPGGARQFGWPYDDHPRSQGQVWAGTVERIQVYEKRVEEYAARGEEMPKAEVPDVARPDWIRLTWMAVGGAVLLGILAIRSRVFWFPHPIGYVMWMGMWPLTQMWFSYFLGWIFKLLLVRFGGQRQFIRWRPFFVGLIVGEALATLVWLFIKYFWGTPGGYNMEFN
jgi:hypothetical protein